MKYKKYFIILLSLMYMDIIFNLFMYDIYSRSGVINIFLFKFLNASIICIMTSIFKEKINKIITYSIYIFLWFWYSFNYIFYKVLLTPFSILLFRQTDQTLKFGKNIIISIFSNIYIIVLFAIPILLLILYRKKINYDKKELMLIKKYSVIVIVSLMIYISNILIQSDGVNSTYSLFYDTNNISLNIEKLGIVPATYLDLKRTIFGFNEKIVMPEKITEDDSDELFSYDYNYQDVDFNKGNVDVINNYMKNEEGTKQNKYTGMFKNKNLVFIVAESFSEIAVSEEYTPTLYKLVHDGFYFENFYTSNNLSTIGGEFQALTGLYADNSILSSWRGGSAYYPYGLGNVFKNLGYNTYAYHNNSAYYQDRNVYLKSQGFDNFTGCYNGLEKKINCNIWPQSDVEMIDATIDDYINSDKPFMTYYMTVSGHFYYNFSLNAMANKNRSRVSNLDYPEEIKGYIATQIELDKALLLLINKLNEANKLDDTVFVLLADHYPYNLSLDNINKLSSYQRDGMIEVNSNNLIIYNSKMKSVKVDKVGMSIDVLPTVLNLFGIEYDSRLIMGRDILSSSEGIAIFKDKSWVTNKGVYRASTGKFEAAIDDYTTDYVDNINNIVNHRVAISRMIVSTDYYRSIFK